MKNNILDIYATITGIKYTPFLCRKLKIYNLSHFEQALTKDATFLLKIDDENTIAVSWWVSCKRTRTYPYVRVYDSLSFAGKKITIIPIIKDEGADGDRDFIQWDTISLMSLLGVYVIIGYYCKAEKNVSYSNKITNQRFDIFYLKEKVSQLISYQSDALHWNLEQTDQIGLIGKKALECYEKIGNDLNVNLKSKQMAEKRINDIMQDRNSFMEISRTLAQEAQSRESKTIQPKEKLRDLKGKITIKNYLGGIYYFTADEAEIKEKSICLIEGKHTKKKELPSLNDIKDGLLKMILFTNLKDITVGNSNEIYNKIPILKLTTTAEHIHKSSELLTKLKREAEYNGFKVSINDTFL